jgi:hypothetical protein
MGLFDYLGDLFGREGGSPSDGRGTAGEAGGPGEYAAVAETFAREETDREFDFTVASLARLDEYATETAATGSFDAGDGSGSATGPVLRLGCYFGEVLVREFDAEWVGDDDVRVVVPAGATSVSVSPFQVARVSLDSEAQFAHTGEELGDRVVESADENPGFELAVGPDGAESADDGTADQPAGDVTAPSDAETDSEARVDGPGGFPSVDLDRGMDLDTAHERTLDAFGDAGYRVTAGDLLNSMPDNPVDGVGRLFLFYTPTEMYTGVVYVGDWNDSDVRAVVSLARYLQADEDLDGLHVVAAVAPPPAVRYLTSAETRARVALDAEAELPDDGTISPATAPDAADIGADLLSRHWDLHVDRSDTATLDRLDQFVFDVLRPVADHAETHEAYVPREALLVVGALAGEVMREGLERELPVTVAWATDEEISTTGVVLRVTTPEADGTLTVNPVGKTFKLYRSGESERLADLYETARRVVEREVDSAERDE